MVAKSEQYSGKEFLRDVAIIALIGGIALAGIEAL
jgi:hypothetical protein